LQSNEMGDETGGCQHGLGSFVVVLRWDLVPRPQADTWPENFLGSRSKYRPGPGPGDFKRPLVAIPSFLEKKLLLLSSSQAFLASVALARPCVRLKNCAQVLNEVSRRANPLAGQVG
jgi:hypothetical protein